MAVKLEMEVGGSGVSGDHWVPCSMDLQRTTDGNTEVLACYRLWLNRDAYENGKTPLRGAKRKVRATVKGVNPTLRDIEAALDAAATAETIPTVPAQQAVEAQPAVKADESKGIKARPAIKAKPAKPAIPGRPGGPLEGGTII